MIIHILWSLIIKIILWSIFKRFPKILLKNIKMLFQSLRLINHFWKRINGLQITVISSKSKNKINLYQKIISWQTSYGPKAHLSRRITWGNIISLWMTNKSLVSILVKINLNKNHNIFLIKVLQILKKRCQLQKTQSIAEIFQLI